MGFTTVVRDRKKINATPIEEKSRSDLEDFSAADISVHLCKEKSSRDEWNFPSRGVAVIFLRSVSLLLLLAGCSSEPHVRAADRLLERLGRDIQDEFSLRFIGSGGSMPETIDELELLFSSGREGTVDEARAVQRLAAQKIVEAINRDEEARPYLKQFPFPPDNLSISISYPRSGPIALAFKKGNEIFYYRTNPESGRLECFFSETNL